MCETCAKEVIEMGIRESDLPHLPHTLVKWTCVVKGCGRFTRVKDYGIFPYYWHPRFVAQWFSIYSHFFLCAKHYPVWKRRHIPRVEDPLFPMPTAEEAKGYIIPITKSKLYKR